MWIALIFNWHNILFVEIWVILFVCVEGWFVGDGSSFNLLNACMQSCVGVKLRIGHIISVPRLEVCLHLTYELHIYFIMFHEYYMNNKLYFSLEFLQFIVQICNLRLSMFWFILNINVLFPSILVALSRFSIFTSIKISFSIWFNSDYVYEILPEFIISNHST